MKRKEEVITLKVDDSLLRAMRGISNRSQFIRGAILAALDNACPVCRGTGTLSPNQKKHWREFAADHALKECNGCHELRLVCEKR